MFHYHYVCASFPSLLLPANLLLEPRILALQPLLILCILVQLVSEPDAFLMGIINRRKVSIDLDLQLALEVLNVHWVTACLIPECSARHDVQIVLLDLCLRLGLRHDQSVLGFLLQILSLSLSLAALHFKLCPRRSVLSILVFVSKLFSDVFLLAL